LDVEGVLKRPLIRHWDPLRTPMFARGLVVSWVRFPVSRNVILQHSPTNLRIELENGYRRGESTVIRSKKIKKSKIRFLLYLYIRDLVTLYIYTAECVVYIPTEL
ncbi:hypothetical protein, partial [Bifidobacterium longum]|uniref:hypothetical protein n=1 Tax=Bifidobacterium longum TaxID=216816 RepID=UPI001A95445A